MNYMRKPDARPWARDRDEGDLLTEDQAKCVCHTRLEDFGLALINTGDGGFQHCVRGQADSKRYRVICCGQPNSMGPPWRPFPHRRRPATDKRAPAALVVAALVGAALLSLSGRPSLRVVGPRQGRGAVLAMLAPSCAIPDPGSPAHAFVIEMKEIPQ